MKKLLKVSLLTGVVSLLAGVALALILFAGFQEEIIAHKEHFSITEDNYWSFFEDTDFFTVFRSGEHHDSSEYTDTCHYDFTQGEAIHEIRFEIAVGDVSITQGDTYSVRVTDMYENAITSRVEDGIWYIEDDLMGSGNVETDYCPYVDIVIPENAVFDAMEIHLAAGKLYAEALSGKSAELIVDAGSLIIDHMVATEKLHLNNGVGETGIYSLTASDVTVDNGVGAVSLCGDIHGKNDITCGVGEVTVTLTNRPEVDFSYSVDCGLGEVKVNDVTYHGSAHHEENRHDGRHHEEKDSFTLDCGIGRIELRLEP